MPLNLCLKRTLLHAEQAATGRGEEQDEDGQQEAQGGQGLRGGAWQLGVGLRVRS